MKKREGANSQWWRDLAGASKKLWAFLTNIERPRVNKRTEFDKVPNEKGEPTTSVEQTLEVQKKMVQTCIMYRLGSKIRCNILRRRDQIPRVDQCVP